MSVLRRICPAKLNLTIAVTGRREDGYHTLRSVFVRTTFHDALAVERGSDTDNDSLLVNGPAGVPAEDNLVLQATRALRAAVPGSLPALHFTLTKRIPVAAGLGGGSSDAATALQLATSAWDMPPDAALLDAIALALGADVPFFMTPHGAALIDGIGESPRRLPPPYATVGVLLVTPSERLSTAAVFGELDRGPATRSSAAEATEALVAALAAGVDGRGLVALAPMLRNANDLWAPAARLSPGLVDARETLESVLQRPILMTGSGPTLFAVYPSTDAAREAAATLEPGTFVGSEGAAINVTTIRGGAQP